MVNTSAPPPPVPPSPYSGGAIPRWTSIAANGDCSGRSQRDDLWK